jgi:transcriptional regulator with XRE-family HTH domain/tetratricopeptide (TPR) repeat protein
MNVNPVPDPQLDAALWSQREMRLALAQRDVATVFGQLKRHGISQRQIAALTGQSQSEISEILSGRQVMAYDVLMRIAEGLGIPPGYLGLGYDPETAEMLSPGGSRVVQQSTPPAARPDDRDAARELIAHAAQVTMGAARFDSMGWRTPLPREITPAPVRIGASDVAQLEGITETLRQLDSRNGGGSCRDAVIAQVAWAQQGLLRAECTEGVSRRLHLAVADLHNLAGWVSFDVGLHVSANQHYRLALEQARYAEDSSLIANVLYRMGRLHLHLVDTVEPAGRSERARDALKLFQLGQIAAQDSGCGLTVAMLCTNEAAAYALLGDCTQALRSLSRAQDEFARAEPRTAASWIRFFGTADLNATIGVAQALVAGQRPSSCGDAIESLTRSLAVRSPDHGRSRIFELTALATVHLIDGDTDLATVIGRQAVGLAEQVHSTRTIDRLGPLRRALALHNGDSDCIDLASRIAMLQTT